MLGLSGTSSYAVFVYLCTCICVFVYLTVQNIIFDVLEPLSFQKNIAHEGYFWHGDNQTTKKQPGEPSASQTVKQ